MKALSLVAVLLPTVGFAQPIPLYDVSGGFFLGIANPWQAATAAAAVVPPQSYRIVGLEGEVARVSGTAPAPLEPPPEDIFEVQFTPSPTLPEAVDHFAVGGTHPLLPRPVRQAALDQTVYREAAGAVLAELGLSAQLPELSQLLRVDLNGDGSDEVLVSATRYTHRVNPRVPAPRVAAGDYSVVFLRHVVDGAVQTQVLGSAVYPEAEEYSAPLQYSVGAVLDVDGDGTLEVIVRDIYYEGIGAIVYRWSATGMEQILSAGWGF